MKSASNPSAFSKEPVEKARDGQRAHDDDWHAPCSCFHTIEEVHAENTGYKGGNHENKTDARELFHDTRHVVVDDAGIGFHG